MLTYDRKDLLVFLADSANELATQAHWSEGAKGADLRNEAEELMAIRAKLLNHHWDSARTNQFGFSFELKQAT